MCSVSLDYTILLLVPVTITRVLKTISSSTFCMMKPSVSTPTVPVRGPTMAHPVLAILGRYWIVDLAERRYSD